jgi:hypothetical protein
MVRRQQLTRQVHGRLPTGRFFRCPKSTGLGEYVNVLYINSAYNILITNLYSIWTAVIGWTLCARRRVAAEHSDKPRYLIFPSSTSFAIAATVVSIGLRQYWLFVFLHTPKTEKKGLKPTCSCRYGGSSINQYSRFPIVRASRCSTWTSILGHRWLQSYLTNGQYQIWLPRTHPVYGPWEPLIWSSHCGHFRKHLTGGK